MKLTKQRKLSKDKIYQAALKIINVEGLESLSMRRLAHELNVEAASLYNHIKNKSELLDLIQENLFKTLPTPKKTQDWKKYLCELAYSMRKGLLQYPKVVPLFATRPSLTISALKQTERVFTVLRMAGFKYSDIVFAYQSLCIFILGHLQAEVGHVPGAIDEIEPSFSNHSITKFPHLLEAYSQSESKNYDNWFDFNIKMIITGLEKILETTRRQLQVPKFVAVLNRKLKPGKVYKDFYQAWLPPGLESKDPTKEAAHYFKGPIKVINAVNTLDPTDIISIGIIWADSAEIEADVERVLDSEQVREEKLLKIIDFQQENKFYKVMDINLLGTELPN